MIEKCFVGTLSEGAWWVGGHVPLDRFTTRPRRPFWLKPWLEKRCREKSHPLLYDIDVSGRALHRSVSWFVALQVWTQTSGRWLFRSLADQAGSLGDALRYVAIPASRCLGGSVCCSACFGSGRATVDTVRSSAGGVCRGASQESGFSGSGPQCQHGPAPRWSQGCRREGSRPHRGGRSHKHGSAPVLRRSRASGSGPGAWPTTSSRFGKSSKPLVHVSRTSRIPLSRCIATAGNGVRSDLSGAAAARARGSESRFRRHLLELEADAGPRPLTEQVPHTRPRGSCGRLEVVEEFFVSLKGEVEKFRQAQDRLYNLHRPRAVGALISPRWRRWRCGPAFGRRHGTWWSLPTARAERSTSSASGEVPR